MPNIIATYYVLLVSEVVTSNTNTMPLLKVVSAYIGLRMDLQVSHYRKLLTWLMTKFQIVAWSHLLF